MVKAGATLNDGTTLLLLGLSDDNVKRLKAGQPIDVNIGSFTLLGHITRIVIWHGATEEHMLNEMRHLIGPQTVVQHARTETAS